MTAHHPRFSAFNITDATYRTIASHPIDLSILTPASLPRGRAAYPVIVRFHGGCLVGGARLHADWISHWLLALALRTPAILVMPDHRLLPEADGAALLSDLRAFWVHLAAVLPAALAPLGLRADLARTLAVGESAGAYLALQSALLRDALAAPVRLAALALLYPMLDLRAPFFAAPHPPDAPRVGGYARTPPGGIDRHIARVRAGELPGVVTAATPPDRMDLAREMLEQGRLPELLGEGEGLYPFENLEAAGEGQLPPVWLVHGSEDTVVPVEGSKRFVEKVREFRPETRVFLKVVEGEEHGFDNEESVGLETGWVKEGVRFLSRYWP